MSPMPSGSRRMTSSVTPGRSVGLIIPTTPRQLENAMVFLSSNWPSECRGLGALPLPVLHGERVGVRGSRILSSQRVPLTRSLRSRPLPASGERLHRVRRCGVALLSVVLFSRRLCRHISLDQIAGKRGRIAPARVAVAAAARALQEESLAGRHLIAARRRRHVFLLGAEPDDEAGAASGLAAGDAARRKAALVVAADDGRALQELVFAPQAQAAAPLPGSARIRHQLEAGDAA